MKKAYIIHGWGGNPNEPLLKWLKQKLESNSFDVQAPQMPNPDYPIINEWITFVQKIIKNPDERTILIGHSIGCQTILRYLETLPQNTKLNGVVLLAPWMHLKEDSYEGDEEKDIAKPWIETPLNWEKIKQQAKKFTAIFSDNDYFVPLADKDIFKEKLNAKIIIEHNKGHFSPSDNIKELPSLLNATLEI